MSLHQTWWSGWQPVDIVIEERGWNGHFLKMIFHVYEIALCLVVLADFLLKPCLFFSLPNIFDWVQKKSKICLYMTLCSISLFTLSKHSMLNLELNVDIFLLNLNHQMITKETPDSIFKCNVIPGMDSSEYITWNSLPGKKNQLETKTITSLSVCLKRESLWQ